MHKIIIFSIISLTIFSCKKKEEDPIEEPVNTLATDGAGVYDVDSNFYKTTIIANSGEWMAENLKTSHYRTGDTIMSGRNLDDISGMSQPSFFFYSNGDSSSINKYGRLYTYYVVDNAQGLCPTGWHVPTKNEWDTLKAYLGGQEVAGGKLKGSDFWASPNEGADNKTLFNAKPSGFRTPEEVYSEITQTAIFWTSTAEVGTKSWSYYLKYNYPTLFQVPSEGKLGLSVRCKRD
ncbi:MAG: fibrobacter succinogenes major paralogous domain-containing protein [Flavobacteriia bacterium]|jgi:uncharacterized protein (TIGR02145 family)